MDLSEMTPEELRAYADRKEAVEMYRSHIPEEDRPEPLAQSSQEPERPGERKPWEREVEVDGVTYTVDMRRFRSREFMRTALDMQDGEASTAEQLKLFDYCFEPEESQILAETVRRVGYEDFEVYYSICAAIFEAVEAKN